MTPKPDWMKSRGAPWRHGEARVKYDNPWLTLAEYDAVAPTGMLATYAVVRFKNLAIAILPLHDDGTVTLVGQHRLPIPSYSWELPEGGGPKGETPLDAARRELREEAGLQAADWREVLRVELSNSVTDERGHGFIAMGLTTAPTDPDETEVIEIARIPFREALDLALAGHMPDMLTVAMLLRAYHMAREGLLPDSVAMAMLS
jgi:8-oxo-dGTP pyrophosphatase MutT (NUDIX family)